MPTYEYECIECGLRFDAFQNMSDDPLKECEHCKSPVKRLISGGSGIIFKGSGFYVTDNKGKPTAGGTAAAKDDQSKDNSSKDDSKKVTETKTEAKSDSGSGSGSEKKAEPKKEVTAAK